MRDVRVANPWIEEPDAIELARPDLRGAGEGNLPGLPDPIIVLATPHRYIPIYQR